MTHAASFGLSAELRKALEATCDGGGDAVGGLQVRIVNEAFALVATLPAASTAQQLAESVAPLLDDAAPCFFLLRLPKLGWGLASWVPDTSDVRQRMLHSSGRDTLRKTVAAQTSLAFEAHWASASEADVAGLFAEPVGEAATLALLTDVERLALADAKATAAEAAAGKVTSAALAFPLQPLAANALAEFEKGVRDLLLLRIEGESVGLLPSPSLPPAEPAPLEAMLPTDAPCYALMRYPQEGSTALLFLYSCPEASAVRAKMLHASCKGAVITSLAERGMTVAKVATHAAIGLHEPALDEYIKLAVEGEPAEHTHANVRAELAAAARSAASGGLEGGDAPALNVEPKVTKTAPRGGRKLTSRR